MRKLPGQLEVAPKENDSVVTTWTESPRRSHLSCKMQKLSRKTVTASNTEAKDEVQREATKSNTSTTLEDTEEAPRAS